MKHEQTIEFDDGKYAICFRQELFFHAKKTDFLVYVQCER